MVLNTNGEENGTENEPMSTFDHDEKSNSSQEENVTDDDSDLSDEGDLSDEDLNKTFSSPYCLNAETNSSAENVFILHMSATKCTNPKNICISLTDNSCAIYDVDQLKKVASWRPHRSSITNVRFSPENDRLLYSSSLDGQIKLWDLRLENKCVNEFKDDTDGPDRLKPLTCFDVCPNDRYLSAGTDMVGADAFLLFWDVRTSAILGGYWESHTDDITQVVFHPADRHLLASASLDGLINIYDIREKSEDDALQQCLNTETSVDKLDWFSHDGVSNSLSCITHLEQIQLWDSDGAAPFFKLDRDELTQALRRKPCTNSYIVDIHSMSNSEGLLVVAGSRAGHGECLRTFTIHKSKVTSMTLLEGNKQIVRTSYYDCNSKILVTAGEGGIISVWKPKENL